jgi:hypothetical protein
MGGEAAYCVVSVGGRQNIALFSIATIVPTGHQNQQNGKNDFLLTKHLPSRRFLLVIGISADNQYTLYGKAHIKKNIEKKQRHSRKTRRVE